MKLYGYWRSSSSWRVRIGLALKGIAYEYLPVHLLEAGGRQYAPAYTERSPMQQVPCLEWDEGGETRRLTQSLAILSWLDATHPTPPLLPGDALDRARAWELAEIVNAGIQPLQNLRTLVRVEQLAPSFGRKAWAAEHIVRGLTAYEAKTAEYGGRYSVGDAISLADCCLVPQLYSARRFGVDPADFPHVAAIEAACAEHPAFVAAHADRQPDAVPPKGG